MSERSERLYAVAEQQITNLLALLSNLDESALRLPCRDRENLGDGTVGACIRHTADNYQRIAGFLESSDQMSAGHAPAPHGTHRMPRVLSAVGHRPPDRAKHPDEQYTAASVDWGALLEQLSAARRMLGRIAALTDARLDAIPPAGSFRFCDGHRNLEQVLRSLLKHQAHQQGALTAART